MNMIIGIQKDPFDWMDEDKIQDNRNRYKNAYTSSPRKRNNARKNFFNENDKIDFLIKSTDLVSEVSVKEPVEYKRKKKKIILVDCGTKNNIIKAFLGRNISVLRVPYDYDFLKEKADGIVISNGPGDPKICTATIENTREHWKIVFQY